VKLLNWRRWFFELRYWRGHAPWDTNTTPPEVIKFLAETPAGRALDLGCGTGTNAITLAQAGWTVVGVDFSPKAIRAARRKAAEANLVIDFRVDDVTVLKDIRGAFNYVLDIGCLFGLAPADQKRYVARLSQLLQPGGRYMLYAWLPSDNRDPAWGISVQAVKTLFAPSFAIDHTVVGQEQGGGSAWYWMTKK